MASSVVGGSMIQDGTRNKLKRNSQERPTKNGFHLGRSRGKKAAALNRQE